MNTYWRFLSAGLILGLFTEAELKLVAGIKPAAFIITLFAYPVFLSIAFAASRLIDRVVTSTWTGDLLHYFAAGLSGLAVEWTLLGNGPGSNAFQLGMFAMWTTFCFGPRVLIRDSTVIKQSARRFWIAFAAAAVVLTLTILLAPAANAKLVIAVLGLSATSIVWSIWLLIIALRSRSIVGR